MLSQDGSFSVRHGLSAEPDEILVRDEAPGELRVAVVHFATEARLPPKVLRRVICRTLGVPPSKELWTIDDLVTKENIEHLESAQWFEVYDVIEAICGYLMAHLAQLQSFQDSLNRYFRRRGIGWKLEDGRVVARGPEAFESVVRGTVAALERQQLPTAQTELHEALRDLSRRPSADLTGAVQHSMAALECVARQATGDLQATLGDILRRHPGLLPRPLDEAVAKAWGYASEIGRHLQEGRVPSRSEAELVVSFAAAAASYVAARLANADSVDRSDPDEPYSLHGRGR